MFWREESEAAGKLNARNLKSTSIFSLSPSPSTPRRPQVLYNLVGNACKFTESGRIWVSARVLEPGEAGPGAPAVPERRVAVTVSDTGVGIPRDKLLDIFGAFSQVDMSSRRIHGGTGLGLALAKQLVEAHGGAISVQSTPGAGSAFTFTLRAWREGVDDRPAAPPAAPAEGKRRRSFSAWLRRRSESPEDAGGAGAAAPAAGGAWTAFGGPAESPPRRSREGPGRATPRLPSLDEGREEASARGERELRARVHAAADAEGDAGGAESAESAADGGSAAQTAAAQTAATAGSALARKPSEPDLAVEADADPEAMRRRLSADVAARSSFEAEKSSYRRAPQQLDPAAAASSFFGATAPLRAAPPAPGAPAAAASAASGSLASLFPPLPTWAGAAAAAVAAAAAGSARVLSVDDDPVNQMVVQTMLRRAGYVVEKAADGAAALRALADAVAAGRPPDAVLCDVMMPGLSGYDVVRRIRREYPGLPLPVLLVSANSREEHVVEGLEAGADDYLVKPLSAKELVARVGALVRAKRFADAALAAAAAAAPGCAPPPALPAIATRVADGGAAA
jgi:CheY-like chemotaxis protein